MKKHEVKVGGVYAAKVSGKVVQVRIDAESRYGGWEATNLATKKKVRIKSPQRLRGAVKPKAETTKAQAGGAKDTAPAADVGPRAAKAGKVERDAKAAPATATGEPTNALEAHYRSQKDAAKTAKAAKVAAWRKEVAEKTAAPDPALDAAVAAAEKDRKTRKTKAAKPKGERKPGVLDGAVEVLKTVGGGPLGCKEMVERMLAKGLWETKGRTPEATLYAAVIREIAAKGKDARFRKTDRGQFALADEHAKKHQ